MRAPVSVIIPTLNAADSLPLCLQALSQGLEAGLIRELILSDGGSQDATADIADQAGATLVSGPASRGGQLRRGAERANGQWLLFLHADTQLSPDWPAAVSAHLATGQAGYFRLQFNDPSLAARIVAGWANLRSWVFGLPYGDQALLIPRSLYDAVGGFCDQPLMEDVAMARALKGRITALDAVATTSAAKYRKSGWIIRGARNLWTLARYFAGVTPERLAQSYRK